MERKVSQKKSGSQHIEMLQTLVFKEKIGATGFEPATSRPPAERATKLRHTPEQSYYNRNLKKINGKLKNS